MNFDGREFECSSTYKRKPTFAQFLKSLGKRKLRKQYLVLLVWVPGTWDNYTLETECFRLRITSTHPLYEQLKEGFEHLTLGEHTLAIQVTDRTRGNFKVIEATEEGSWQLIGDNGFKFLIPGARDEGEEF